MKQPKESPLSVEEMLDRLEMLNDQCHQEFAGSNEAELDFRQQVASFIVKHREEYAAQRVKEAIEDMTSDR